MSNNPDNSGYPNYPTQPQAQEGFYAPPQQQPSYAPPQQASYTTPQQQQPQQPQQVYVAPQQQQQQQQPSYAPPQMQNGGPVMYVFAPQGYYPVPGNPNLYAVPQGHALPAAGQPISPAQANFAPIVVNYISSSRPIVDTNARDLGIAALITYFLFPPASAAISLHMVAKKYIVKRKPHVTSFAILELLAFVFLLSICWYSPVQCYDYSYNDYYTGRLYTTHSCYRTWMGWIGLVVYLVAYLAFGIPRVIFSWRNEAKYGGQARPPAPVAMTTFSSNVTH